MVVDGMEKYFEEKFSSLGEKLELIHEQTLKTNGRVTKLEEQTAVVRFLYRNPKLCIIIGLGMIFIPRTVVAERISDLLFKAL